MMRIMKIVLTVLVLGSLIVVAPGCGEETEETVLQTATVQRGDLSVEITASGNLELSVMENLAFEMAGTVDSVQVDAGDSVTEGQVLATLDTSEWEDDLASLEMSLLEAEINLENAELDLEDAEDDSSTTSTGDIQTKSTDPKQIDILELKVQKAEYTYNKAKEALEDARNASPGVVAPFDGFITAVNVEGGDEITKGTVAVTIADPDKFEAEIYVSELDIVNVELGSTASVAVDALDITVPAEVTHISPTATIQSGVVNYTVRVELESLDTLIQEQQAAMQNRPDMSDMASGQFPPPIQQAIDSGEMTQEEAEAQMEQMQQQMAAAQAEQQAALENIQLREGLTVTVSLVVEEATDVLLVPNGAITTTGGQASVQVVSADGSTEQRTVTTGISDWQYTEVTDGLSEGEEVVVPEGTATTTTNQFGPPGGGMMIPGMGGFR
jgi:RND family efflux transporter MFP subunit